MASRQKPGPVPVPEIGKQGPMDYLVEKGAIVLAVLIGLGFLWIVQGLLGWTAIFILLALFVVLAIFKIGFFILIK